MYSVKKSLGKINIQSFIVSLCILAVCVATQRIQTAAWNSGIVDFARDSLGVLMAVIIFTHYKWSDFVRYKIPYIIWSILGILSGAVLIPIAFDRREDFLKADTVIVALGIFLMGYCVIHTVISFFVEKYRPRHYRPLFIMWVIMMALMIFSRTDYLWPKCYFVLFFCYYMTDRTPAQRENVVRGLVNGMILGFVAIQSHSLLCRPYDIARYRGNFCNSNNNCLFLCLCLAAILAKLLFLTKENKKIWIRVFFFLLAETCYAFIFMTGGRSGYIAAVVVTVFFLIIYCRIREKRVFFRMGMLLVSLFVVFLPITYLGVRYVPTIHPHVLFYYQEGYSESLVHSWDERDSEKYITFQQMLESVWGRFSGIGNLFGERHEEGDMELPAQSQAVTSGIGTRPVVTLARMKKDIPEEEIDPDTIPALSEEEFQNSFLVRYTIYKWFFTHMTLRGMPYKDQGFQLTQGYWVQHAHNIYLDYGINFGYPVMILFVVFAWWGIGRLLRQGLRKGWEQSACLLIALIPLVFGMLEYAWGAGTISTVTLYLAFREMCEA